MLSLSFELVTLNFTAVAPLEKDPSHAHTSWLYNVNNMK